MIGLMYVAVSVCLLIVAYAIITARPGGYSEAEIGTALYYGLLIYLVAIPSGLIGVIASIIVLARERKRRSAHAWMALLFIAVGSVTGISLYLLPILAG